MSPNVIPAETQFIGGKAGCVFIKGKSFSCYGSSNSLQILVSFVDSHIKLVVVVVKLPSIKSIEEGKQGGKKLVEFEKCLLLKHSASHLQGPVSPALLMVSKCK